MDKPIDEFSDVSSFSELQNLLFRQEKEDIDSLRDKINHLDNSQEQRIESFLSSEYVKAEKDLNSPLRSSLEKIIPMSLTSEIKNNPDTIIDTLYPVIGGIVNKYVSESIKDLMDSINDRIEETVNENKFVNTIKARSQGLSLEEYVLKKSQNFLCSGVFLIDMDSGVVIHENVPSELRNIEADLFGGMLVAIRSFGQDCISQEKNSELGAIDYGDFKILLERAGSVLLAVIVESSSSKTVIRKARNTLSLVLQQNIEFFNDFQGNVSSVPDSVKNMLNEIVASNENGTEVSTKSRSKFLVLIPLILIAALFFYKSHLTTSMEKQLGQNQYFSELDLSVHGEWLNFTKFSIEGYVPSVAFEESILGYISNSYPEKGFSSEMKLNDKLSVKNFESFSSLLESLNVNMNLNLVTELGPTPKVFGHVREQSEITLLDKSFRAVGLEADFKNVKISKEKFNFILSFSNGHKSLTKEQAESIRGFLKELASYNKTLKLSYQSNKDGSESVNREMAKKRIDSMLKFLTLEFPDVKVSEIIISPPAFYEYFNRTSRTNTGERNSYLQISSF